MSKKQIAVVSLRPNGFEDWSDKVSGVVRKTRYAVETAGVIYKAVRGNRDLRGHAFDGALVLEVVDRTVLLDLLASVKEPSAGETGLEIWHTWRRD